MATAELRDRRMIRATHPGDHLERHVLPARPLNPPRPPVPARIRIQKQRHQHRRIVRSATRRTQPIPLGEPGQIHLLHRAQHRPHQMILRQPLPLRRRHQQHLPTLTTHEFSSHPGSLLNPPDGTDIPTASPRCARALGDVAAVEAIAGVVDCRANGQCAGGSWTRLLLDAWSISAGIATASMASNCADERRAANGCGRTAARRSRRKPRRLGRPDR